MQENGELYFWQVIFLFVCFCIVLLFLYSYRSSYFFVPSSSIAIGLLLCFFPSLLLLTISPQIVHRLLYLLAEWPAPKVLRACLTLYRGTTALVRAVSTPVDPNSSCARHKYLIEGIHHTYAFLIIIHIKYVHTAI
ncbi:hypothetical protein PITC_082990 [Penicillium italicum]|uniref:Uncharacterized protein n=1 Tax=Penicillium italicum TaxID=40296 RepID=A0A0A2LDJ8_PENIT|nr:hypothetical protein PITC_082990 [Penicillium italicum]